MPAVLEEDVGVLELGHVEGDALALLREGALRAPDQARALETVDATVAGGDRDSVLAAQVDRGLRLPEGGNEDLRRILVRDESRSFKGIHRLLLLPLLDDLPRSP